MVNLRFAVLGLVLVLPGIPALADEVAGAPTSRLAPADEYFGRAKMSVLGIANTIRDAGRHLQEGASPQETIDGPLHLAAEAIRDWENKYPDDHWIPRDLLALEYVYLRAGSRETADLARRTAGWIVADYPNCEEAHRAQVAVGGRVTTARPTYAVDASDDEGGGSGAWQQYQDMRRPPR